MCKINKYLISIILTTFIVTNAVADNKMMFISFSMPEKLLIDIYQEAEELAIPVVLNGLVDDDFKKTMKKMYEIGKKFPHLAIQIDPVSFKKYGITQVPALAVIGVDDAKVVYGNITISDALKEVKKDSGEHSNE